MYFTEKYETSFQSSSQLCVPFMSMLCFEGYFDVSEQKHTSKQVPPNNDYFDKILQTKIHLEITQKSQTTLVRVSWVENASWLIDLTIVWKCLT